ncbi:menaquinone-dependent protoporphyrinogen IX dehydrogenase [Volucribacter amazonae]|uniref:Protoporphyrinogen IX dehydrogenase [quinone] n=1 Tax=Volucribacter amazonae TaxID=256731 RepID=A0A9X4PDE3_9PAST|nr:menaquinone-dependent protoporphyrinogen IX dehydrogenase [Volucribacter amazonae]MDG6895599.1 protoporphyrinogen oxidase [Volucribacter amazonae]
MKTLILYSSRDGQTKKIAYFIAQQLQQISPQKEVVIEKLEQKSAVDFQNISCVIIGASIRYGHFESKLYAFIQRYAAQLNQIPSAFFSVNLTARKAGKDSPETNVYTRKLLQKISWQPTYKAVFAGALYYPRYNFFDRIMIQFIMRLTGGETDTSKEIEYTDWGKVKEFAELIDGRKKNSGNLSSSQSS